jgi:hypothetical protein
VPSFSASAAVGRWYQLKVDTDQLKYSQGFTDCAAVDFEGPFTFGANGKASKAWLRGRNTAQKQNAYGASQPLFQVYDNVTQPSADGVLTVTFDPNTFGPGSPSFSKTENVVYVGTDSTTGKYDFLINTNGYDPAAGLDTNFTSLVVLSRINDVTLLKPAYAQALANLLTTTGFQVPLYTVPQPASCYYSGPGVSPMPVASFDPSLAIGLWYQHRLDVTQLQFQHGTPACAAISFDPMDRSYGFGLVDRSAQQSYPALGPQSPVQTLTVNVTVPDLSKPGFLSVKFGTAAHRVFVLALRLCCL